MPQPHKPPETRLYRYVLPDGWEVWAGRTDLDNDRLSLKMASPQDYWFHVRGMSGSHVILRVPAGRQPDSATIKAAAAIAAWHSKKRAAKQVGVSCTRARFVSKPPGAQPGTVQIRREKTITVRPALPASDPPEAG